jgi:uncharacterized protein (DUF4415 family)
MKKKSIELSARELQTKMKEKSISRKTKDSEIDYSDIQKFSAKELKKFKRVGRPLVGESPRKAISVRIEEDVLEKLKTKAEKAGVGYQSLINEILKKAV